MGFFDNESKQRKNDMIALQNIVLDINEKKLQVSEEFLEKMTKIYVSKYIKIVNDQLADMNKVTNIRLMFRKYDAIMASIDELVKIEPYHKFRKPAPSAYRETVNANLESFIMSLISREWKKIAPQNTANNIIDVNQEGKMRAFFETFDDYYSRMPKSCCDTIDRLKASAFPDEAVGAEETAEPSYDLNEEFVPATFERLDSLPQDGETDNSDNAEDN